MRGETEVAEASSEAFGQIRSLAHSLPMALVKAREATMRLFRPRLQARELTEQQWRVLRALGGVETIDATSLANKTVLLAPSLTRILRELERRELVRRGHNTLDRRAAVISLSPKGHELLGEVGAEFEDIYRAIELHVGAEALEDLVRRLGDVENRLHAMVADAEG